MLLCRYCHLWCFVYLSFLEVKRACINLCIYIMLFNQMVCWWGKEEYMLGSNVVFISLYCGSLTWDGLVTLCSNKEKYTHSPVLFCTTTVLYLKFQGSWCEAWRPLGSVIYSLVPVSWPWSRMAWNCRVTSKVGIPKIVCLECDGKSKAVMGNYGQIWMYLGRHRLFRE